MHFTEDFNYINSIEKELIKRGYGKLTVYSLNFDQYFTATQQKKNKTAWNTANWSDYCDKLWGEWSEKATMMLDELAEKYSIYQYKDSNVVFGDEDLFFWSDRGWNEKDYMTGFSLTFNDKRPIEDNLKLLNELKLTLSDYSNCFTCRVQYDAEIDDKQVKDYIESNIGKVQGKMISYGLRQGKVKWVDCNNEYGFFKKGAKTRYYRLTPIELFNIIENNAA